MTMAPREFELLTSILLLLCTSGYSTSSREGKVLEYCRDELFQPQCNDGAVVAMATARYGHIQLGRCVDEDLGRLGCYTDQLLVMDRLCSGRQSCSVHFGDSDMEGEFPCSLSKAFARYLEASFNCVPVYQLEGQTCSSGREVRVSSRKSYISSSTTANTGCGTETNPWVLKAQDGQKINISFIDFNWKVSSRNESPVNCPVRYGYLLDVTSNDVVNLCGGLVRERVLYASKGSTVQILLDKNVLNKVNFLVAYQAVGCPDYKSPPNTWVKETDGSLKVGCAYSDEHWSMRCIGTYWLGPQKDCNKYETPRKTSAQSVQASQGILGLPKAVFFALFGGITLVIVSIALTVAIGMFCIRRPKHKSTGHMASPVLPVNEYPTCKSVVKVKLGHHIDTLRQAGVNTLPGSQRNTMSSMGSIPRYPPNVRDSPHYYLLEGREPNDVDPVYDVVYQGLPADIEQ